MENDFKKPTLEVLDLMSCIKSKKIKPDVFKEYIIKEGMVILYEKMSEEDYISFNKNEYNSLKEKNKKCIDDLKKEIEENSENEALILNKQKEMCELYAQALDVHNFDELSRQISSANPSSSLKMDILLCKIRIALILKDVKLLENSVALARNLCESGCDWDRRNKFKVYEGLYFLKKKDFKAAARLFSESLNTFESPELFSFDKLCLYTIFCGLISFKRNEIYDKILTSSNILEEREKLELGIRLADSFYLCDYSVLLTNIYRFVISFNDDLHLKNIKNIFLREMKVKAYKQLLSSYKTLSMQTMANILGMNVNYLENDLIKFISTDKLNCKIDRISMTVSVVEESYDETSIMLEKGDELLRMVRKNLK